MKALRSTTDQGQATTQLNAVKAYLDRLATKGVVHKNTAAHYKSKLEKHVRSLG